MDNRPETLEALGLAGGERYDVNEPWSPLNHRALSREVTDPFRTSGTIQGEGSSSLSGTYEDGEFMSTRSVISKTTFFTAPVGSVGHAAESTSRRLQNESEYAQLLARNSLWPVDLSVEQNWSGRGQHVEFQKDDRKTINEILDVQRKLGHTNTAIVESVKCRRILLARKTIFCNRHFTKEQAIQEVAHLTRLQHSHVVRVIGTYTLGKELSILMYPVAECNLDDFLHRLVDWPKDDIITKQSAEGSCVNFFACLSNALEYVHGNLTKHMDIKPQNILVRKQSITGSDFIFKAYLADFGISRSYKELHEVDTYGPTSFTRKYAAPEVADQETRGLPADVFSLGCVFLEMLAALYDTSDQIIDLSFEDHFKIMQDFVSASGLSHHNTVSRNLTSALYRLQALLESNADHRPWYHANVGRLLQYFSLETWTEVSEKVTLYGKGDPLSSHSLPLILGMISIDPRSRPIAEELASHFGQRRCCRQGSEPLEAIAKDEGD